MPDPWAEAAKNYKPTGQGASTPASSTDYKIWQQPDTAEQGNPGFFGPLQDAYDDAVKPTTGPLQPLEDFGRGVMELAEPVMHPVKTFEDAMPHDRDEAMQDLMSPGSRQLAGMAKGAVKDFRENGPAEAIPHIAGQVAGGFIAGEGLGMAGEAGAAAREAAMGDADASALKGLGVGPKSPRGLRTMSAIEGARPFLRGATDLADLQGKVAEAKGEIWQPYNDALDAVGGKKVKGPDGMTTVRELEEERAQLSALNRGLKTNSPEALQLAQQKGMTAAQLLERERAIQSALDPELAKTGIDPKAIRKAFGQVSEVGRRASGKTTVAETAQPSGFGKIAKLDVAKPLQAPPEILSGLRDLLAGRPAWEMKPTDVNIREGFRAGGEKPNFGRVTTTGYGPPPRALLTAGAREMPAPEYDGTVEGYRPPPIDAATTPIRTGRLLSAPPRPMEAPPYDASSDAKPPAYRRDTTPMRKGRLLPREVPARDLPLSSYHDIFPDQIAQGRLLDLIRESRKK